MNKGNVAIIDDDVLVRQALGDCMESAGYAVKGFGSAEEFLASGAAGGVACLVVDIQLPGMTGLELQAKLSGAEDHPPIIFVSAQATNAKRQGASGFLPKPVRREDLLQILGQVIER